MLDKVSAMNLLRQLFPKNQSSIGFISLLLLLLSACSSEVTTSTGIPSTLNPRGSAAADIDALWWLMFVLGTLVFVFVTGLLLYILFRRRRYQPEHGEVDLNPPESHSWLWYGGVIMPAVILSVVLFFTLRSISATAQPARDTAIEIQVIGRQWFWQINYINEIFSTANEIHIPVGQPVLLRLTSADVIHSFWVPQLHGKMDLIPGRTNTFWIQADEPGKYRGICAEYCGIQHAKMHLVVVAGSEEEYAQWVEQQRQPAPVTTDEQIERGREVFENSDCAFCHTIRGTTAEGKIGPDLTHVGSRETIAAGALPNTRGNLGAWIADPQHIKPGSFMPSVALDSEEFIAVLDFLQSLE